jgi:hypothetical protein
LSLEVIDAASINTSLPQLRRKRGMHVFIQVKDQRDGGVFPCWYACVSRWISSSISER